MTDQAEDNPLEQLIELFVYAPIGMLYEYPEVLPQLIKKGRSQVQLAKFFGQMAARQRGVAPSDPAAPAAAGVQAVDAVAKLAAKFITELGSQVGLAPPSDPGSSAGPAAQTATGTADTSDTADVTDTAHTDPLLSSAPSRTAKLPIAGYNDLTAKEIIGLLEDLTHDQLVRVRDHEAGNRNRKTVLAKIDRLLP